jgi:glycosyltransferase involved in cell wall biosynthesis
MVSAFLLHHLEGLLVAAFEPVPTPFPGDAPLSEQKKARGGTLFLLTETFHSVGGIQNYNRDQIQALRACEPDKPLTLLVLNDTPEDVREKEWEGLQAKGHSRKKVTFALASLWHAWRQRPDRIVLGHRTFLPLAIFLAIFGPRSSKWLLVYGVDAWPRLKSYEQACLRSIQRVFSISPYTAERFQLAGCRQRIELWPCSLPFWWKPPQPAAPRFEKPYHILSVTRLAPPERYKGVDTTLHAVGILTREGVQVRYHIVGEGENRPQLQAIAREEGIADRTIFHGRVSDSELQAHYRDCDLFVLPSGGEGFGIVYLEAMAHAKPVIAAEAAATPFVVRPHQSGVLVPYGDPPALAKAIAECCRNAQESRELGAKARRFLEDHFLFSSMQQRVQDLMGRRCR